MKTLYITSKTTGIILDMFTFKTKKAANFYIAFNQIPEHCEYTFKK